MADANLLAGTAATGGARAGRVAPQLTPAQAATQFARLAEAVPCLRAAYLEALRRWEGDPALRLLGLPIVAECYRSSQRQDELYTHGRTAPGPVVTYKRGGESNHNADPPTPALDVAFILPDGAVSWSGLLLSKFARLVKAADARVRWGGDWPRFKDFPHFEVVSLATSQQ